MNNDAQKIINGAVARGWTILGVTKRQRIKMRLGNQIVVAPFTIHEGRALKNFEAALRRAECRAESGE